jgi:hypothetical protein
MVFTVKLAQGKAAQAPAFPSQIQGRCFKPWFLIKKIAEKQLTIILCCPTIYL